MQIVSAEFDQLKTWCKGEESAACLLHTLGKISQIADDFVDGDKPIDKTRDMTQLLCMTLIEIPNNAFFVANKPWLSPLLSSSLLMWDASNRWEKSEDETTQMFGFTYREILEQVIIQCAMLCGGFDHARQVAQEVRAFYQTKETFKDWKAAA